MATATYDLIASQTLGSAASSITFSSIAASWTDLRLVFVGTSSSSAPDVFLRFNNVSTGTYSITALNGNGTTAASTSLTNQTEIDPYSQYGSFSTPPAFISYDIFSYAGSTYKTTLITVANDKNGTGNINLTVGLWRSTAAITTVTLSTNVTSFAAGTTANLYGILKA
jgi:hypothetical protein